MLLEALWKQVSKTMLQQYILFKENIYLVTAKFSGKKMSKFFL